MESSVYEITGRAQGTTYYIKYYADQALIRKESIDSIFRVIDNSMSLYQPTSSISKFNAIETKALELDEHMLNVVGSSLRYNQLTKGYFDITVFPLIQLWGFGANGIGKAPNDTQVDSVKRFVGINNISLKGKTLSKQHPNVSIDLNGIAQGYTVDVIAAYLSKVGILSFMVEVGGEIYAKGLKSDSSNYKIEIQRPEHNRSLSHQVILQDMAITTSGNYEKYRKINGQYLSHHMNPFTGKPVMNNVLSATVIAKTAMEADALDNYLMYLNPQEAITLVEELPQVEAYIIYSENNTIKVLQSSGFNNYIYKLQS